MNPTYQICTRCVMDTTDPDIQFDEDGVCNHCRTYDRLIAGHVFAGEEGRRQLDHIVAAIKREGARKKYDCVIGVSGGVDSTYSVLKAKELGLRPLAVHLDNGWDSELAAGNIHKALTKLGIDLYTYVIDWEEFKDLQIAFLRASTPDVEIPTDHAIVALMYQVARRIGTRYIITGCNNRTESHLPRAWSQGHMDWKYIRSVHKQFGHIPLRTFPHIGFWTYAFYLQTRTRIDILDYLNYVKGEAIQTLEREFGWQYYGGKHYESIYTRFCQGYILPRKFGYDKRRTHFSSLICSGEMTREEALRELEKEPYPIEMQMDDHAYVLKKLGLTEAEFTAIMNLPRKTYRDYPSYRPLYESRFFALMRKAYRFINPKSSVD